MVKLATYFGAFGSALGLLAGLIELTIGAQIPPWIGNKENPAILGVVTFLLSGMALGAIVSARSLELPSNDSKLAVFLGVFLPAMICFTTVGRLWYLPGPLLTVAALLLALEYWFCSPPADLAGISSSTQWTSRIIGGIGSVFILASVGLGFWKSPFGLFQFDTLLGAERFCFEVVPMDLVLYTHFSDSATTVEAVEVGRVMIVYILLLLGAALALIASLTASRLFLGIGGGIASAGLVLFLIWLPRVLTQVQHAYASESLLNLVGSLGWGWYASAIGAIVILATSLLRVRKC